ncbi:Pet309 [Kluyveromyces lactis]|nr:Pet309 [Kluyveromyces lactis]
MLRVSTLIGNQYIRRFSNGSIHLAKNPWLKRRSLEQLSKSLPAVPIPVLEVVHKCSDDVPLDEEQRLTIKDYLTHEETEIPTVDRSILLKYLCGKKEYDMVETMAKLHLFDKDGHFLETCTVNNVQIYFEVLIQTKQLDKLTEEAVKYISQFSINKQGSSVYMINYLFVKLYQNFSPQDALYIWTKLVSVYYGHCELTSMDIYGPILNHLYYFFKASKESHQCVLPLLKRMQHEDGIMPASHLASTLITFFSSSRWFSEVERIWHWKVDRNLPIVASDLTAMMRSRCHFRDWDTVINLHHQYSLAQDDYMQFDYLLVALAKKQDWDRLKHQFDALFGIGELPTVNHYGVIMYALSMHGELELVEKLHGQLLRRDMTPSYAVLLSIINAHYNVGDYNGAVREFALFKRYGIRPTSASYLIVLKAYKKMGSLDSCFRVLKTMSAENIPLNEAHFKIIIELCGKLDNYPVAEELFNVMTTDYFIQPTGLTISALIRTFLKSKKYKEAWRLIQKYENVVTVDKFKIVQQKIMYYVLTGDTENAEEQLKIYFRKKYKVNSNFYMILLQHLVAGRKDCVAAEKVLDELVRANMPLIKPDHFNILLEEYNRIGYLEGISNTISKIVDNQIPMNSKTLYFLVKSRFELNRKKRESPEFLLGWLEEILESIAKNKLNFTTRTIHPSVVTWPMNFISRNDDPSKAVDLFTKYVKLFFPRSRDWNNKLVVLRSLLIVSAESGKWEDFDILFTRYKDKLSFFQNQPSAVVPNNQLKAAFVGLFEYKIKRMRQLNEINRLPSLIEELENKGYILSNNEWNEALWRMIRRKSTFDFAMKRINGMFIRGYTWIHRARSLRKRQDGKYNVNDSSSSSSEESKTNLYLKSENYDLIMIQIDKYLRYNSKTLEREVKRLIIEYPYVMKQYLRKPRNDISNWDIIERNHSAYLRKLRSTYEVVPLDEF